MKKFLLAAVIFLAVCLASPAAEKLPYKCILNTPEIPKDSVRSSLTKSMADNLLRAPYAGYVCVDAIGESEHSMKMAKIVKSDPPGVWDKLAGAITKRVNLHEYTTGSHFAHFHDNLHMVFYTVTKPWLLVLITDNSLQNIQVRELTPPIIKALLADKSVTLPEAKGVPQAK